MFQEKIAKGLIVRRQSDYPAMDEIMSDWDSEGSEGKKKSSKTSTKVSISYSHISYVLYF